MTNEGIYDEREDGEIAFVKLPDGTWELIHDDPNDPEFEIIDPIKAEKVYTRIENMKHYGWKVRQNVDLPFDGFILYKPKEEVN